MSGSFPVELWTHVGTLLERSALMNLALVSRLHLEVARRQFCQSITLNSSRFDLLESGEYDMHRITKYLIKYDLGSAVQEILVWGYFVKPALEKILEVTPGLRSLSMIIAGRQCFLASAKAQRKFVKLLQTSCPSLETFRMNGSAHLKDADFAIPNLKAVKWKEFGRVSPAFISLCRASQATLTEISLAVHDGAYTEFFSLIFPSLLLFKIGPGHQNYGRSIARAKAIASGLTTFLLKNRTIESLNLVYASVTDISRATYISLRPKLLDREMLPNLKTLHAHPNQVAQMAVADVESLRRLKTLRVSDKAYNRDYGYDFAGMLEKLAKIGPLFVRNFVCETPYDGSRNENFAADIRNMAAAFPELECWDSSSSGNCLPEQLIELFSPFAHLRKISDHISSSKKKDVFTTDTVAALAEKCPALESLAWHGNRPPTLFAIVRSVEGQVNVSSVDLVVEDRTLAYDYHPDSDADNDEPRSDDEFFDEEDGEEDGEDEDGDEGK